MDLVGRKLGVYFIESEVGSGGMGRVYRAAGPQGTVALKVIHPHLLESAGFFKRFLREADIGRKVNHPAVVRTLDCDQLVVGGAPRAFLVMEYVEGRNLRDLLADLGTVPEALVREIAVQIAMGLQAIHAQGVVHRDLKPENVMLTDAHEIRIMDLGVAKLAAASKPITSEGQFAGSLAYAAPEQFKRAVVGPPADLYALGVVLYELATGRNPFRSVDDAAIIEAHLHLTPPPAHECNEDLSVFFGEVVSTLLAKGSRDRFPSAGALLAVLQEAESSAWWRGRAGAVLRREARFPRLPVNRTSALFGREEELATLREAWKHARGGEGRTVFLVGEAGIGKTRLIDAFLRDLSDTNLHALYGSYPPSGGLGGLSDAVLGKFGAAGLAQSLAPYLEITASLVPAFAALVKHEGAPAGAEPLQRDALHAVVVHLMRALAAERPTLWIMDDMHFAPRESREILLAMARAVEGHPILLVASSRPGVDLAEFSRLSNFDRIPLDRLSPREVVLLLEDAFQSAVLAEKLGGKIALKSDGVPFFIFEMIRGLKEGQFVRQLPDGSYVETRIVEEIEVPSAVKDLVEHRMDDLTESQRAILDAGAVCGFAFDPGLVARVLDQARIHVLRELAVIERRHGLVRGEAGRTRFDQHQIQEVLYEGLPPDLRAEYHTLLAGARAERCGADPADDDVVFLAHHHLRGSRPELARPYLELALDHLQKTYRNDNLLDLAGRALDVAGLLEPAERVEMLLRRAAGFDLFGRRDDQRQALDEALALADGIGADALRGRVRLALGRLLIFTSQHEAARVTLAEVLELAAAAGDGNLEGKALGNLGILAWIRGRSEEAQARLVAVGRLLSEIGDRHGEASALGNLANVFRTVGQYEEAREHLGRALVVFGEIGDRRGVASVTANLGLVYTDLGMFEKGQGLLEDAVALSREIGYRGGEVAAIGNLGLALRGLGLYRETREHLNQRLALSREIGLPRGEAIATANLGSLLRLLGQPGEARRHLERGLALARKLGHVPLEGSALADLAHLAKEEGDMETAVDLCEKALAVQRGVGDRPGEARSLITLGLLEADRKNTQAATKHLENALALSRQVKGPGLIAWATVARASLPDGDVPSAVLALEEQGERVGHEVRMEAHFRLWGRTRDGRHLEEAYRLLCHARDHAPEECRASMVEHVPLHHAIVNAWKTRGGGGPTSP